MEEKGKWAFPEAKARGIIKSVEAIFRTGNINRLTQEAYKFITLHHGFIAHYDIGGFRAVYDGIINEFAKNLIYGEGGIHSYHDRGNFDEACRQEQDKDFNEWYGTEYCKATGRTMLAICEIAEKHLNPLGLRLSGVKS